MQIEMIKVSRLVGYTQNARVHSEDQIKQISGSITEFGFTNPVLINDEDVLIAGHGRLEAAKALGIEEVPAIRLGHLSIEQQRALVIADNRIAENSSWDEDMFASEIAALEAGSFDIGSLGFGESDITRLLDGLSDEVGGENLQAMPDGSLQITLGDQVVLVSGENLSVEAVEGSVLRVDKPRQSKLHPTMKPIDLIVRMLRNSSQRGSVVLDPFGGSGSTLIACEMLSRKARLIELDPKFCDVIVRRWQDLTGLTANLDGCASTFAEIEAERSKPKVDAA